MERRGVYLDLGYTQPGIPVGDRAHIHLGAGGAAAILGAPLSHLGSQVVAVPETAVEHRGKAVLHGCAEGRGEGTVGHGIGRFPVASGHRLHVVGAAGTALNLEHLHAGFHELVQELDGAEVLRGHEVFVVHVDGISGLVVGKEIAAAAGLQAIAPVGAFAIGRQRQVAFARNRHAKGTVREHLDAHELPGGSFDLFLLNALVNDLHLLQAQFPGQHHHIGPLRIEAKGLEVGDAQLRGDMHLQADFPAIENARHVGGDDGIHTGSLGGIQGGIGFRKLLPIQGDVEGHVGLDAVGAADAQDLRQVFL